MHTWTSSAAEDPNLKRAVMVTRRFRVDAMLETWVADQRIHKGINPVSANVAREAKSARHATGIAVPSSKQSPRQ